jgi:hypothetical protein
LKKEQILENEGFVIFKKDGDGKSVGEVLEEEE